MSGRYDDSDTLFENPEVQMSHDLSQISLPLPSVTRYGITTVENKESSEAHISFVMGDRGANKSYKMGGGHVAKPQWPEGREGGGNFPFVQRQPLGKQGNKDSNRPQ